MRREPTPAENAAEISAQGETTHKQIIKSCSKKASGMQCSRASIGRFTKGQERISSAAILKALSLAQAINLIWNYCNETQMKAARDGRKWLTG
jgi:hypothetical protein